MYKIMDGKLIKRQILEELKNKVSEMEEKPSLVVIQIGDNDASNVYIKQKAKMADYIGYGYRHIKLDENVSEEEVLKIIDELNQDKKVNGVMVQMPLPRHINTDKVQNAVIPSKDVDGLSDYNAGLLFHNKEALYSCTPYGVMELFKRYNISLEGRHAVVVGRSNLVGKPMAMLLLRENGTVTICHSKTQDMKEITRQADILVVAIGKPKFVDETYVKEGAVVIDVGIHRNAENKLCGDVDFDKVAPHTSAITPVPGGVGPMTIAMLMNNCVSSVE